MKAGLTLVPVMAVYWTRGTPATKLLCRLDTLDRYLESWSGEQFTIRQQEHSRGYPKHTDCEFARQSNNSTHSTALH
ncbi:hypothetical protein TNCV_1552751 [Trichonephila clavipes]|nr:hypothetical protein TNCV_1552751 [Trichonephila clavipes]